MCTPNPVRLAPTWERCAVFPTDTDTKNGRIVCSYLLLLPLFSFPLCLIIFSMKKHYQEDTMPTEHTHLQFFWFRSTETVYQTLRKTSSKITAGCPFSGSKEIQQSLKANICLHTPDVLLCNQAQVYSSMYALSMQLFERFTAIKIQQTLLILALTFLVNRTQLRIYFDSQTV